MCHKQNCNVVCAYTRFFFLGYLYNASFIPNFSFLISFMCWIVLLNQTNVVFVLTKDCRCRRFGKENMFFELTQEYDRSFEGFTKFKNTTMNAKRVKLDSSLVKDILIEILVQVIMFQLKLNDIMIYIMINLK